MLHEIGGNCSGSAALRVVWSRRVLEYFSTIQRPFLVGPCHPRPAALDPDESGAADGLGVFLTNSFDTGTAHIQNRRDSIPLSNSREFQRRLLFDGRGQ
ncbi:MAG: hypothetical protein ACREV7_17360 [Steroidobacteraceae bacterium]